MAKKKRYQYSKKIPVITGIIFSACIIIAVFNPDSTTSVTALTVSGGIFGASIIWYMKKSQVENSFKLKSALYEKAANVRYEYSRKILELQREFCIDQNKIDEIESRSPIDEFEDEALYSLKNTVDTDEADAHEPVRIEY